MNALTNYLKIGMSGVIGYTYMLWNITVTTTRISRIFKKKLSKTRTPSVKGHSDCCLFNQIAFVEPVMQYCPSLII